MAEERVLRVSQLDTTELDEELLSVLQEQLLAVFKVLPAARLLQFKPELRAALKTFLWWFSVRAAGQTFGQRMLDLQYSTAAATSLSSRHKWTLLILSVSLEWLRERAHLLVQLARLPLTPRALERLFSHLSAAISALSLLNFTLFLLQGWHPTLSDRLIQLTLSPSQPQTLRQPNHQFLSREIMWHGFSEFLFFILPHINTFSLRNWLWRLTLPPSHLPQDPSLCAWCGHSATMAQTASCGHMYCYYCLQANCMADSHFTCSVCGQKTALKCIRLPRCSDTLHVRFN